MNIYTIIGGVNGAGKSSLSGVLSAVNTDSGIIIDADRITAENDSDRISGKTPEWIKELAEYLDRM